MTVSTSNFPRPEANGKIRRAAFTLIEVMIALIIFTMVIAAIYATWQLVMRSTVIAQAAAARAQRERIAMRTIEDSLMSIQSFQASQQYYSFIVKNGDEPVLSFASRVPDVFPRNGKFGDFNLRRLTFTLEAGDGREKNLVLRQNPILMTMDDDEQKYPLILARDVKTFSIECWDTNQLDWVTEWDDTNSIPPMVRIGLVLGADEQKNDSSFNSSFNQDAADTTVIRAFSLPSSMMPAVVQTGGAGFGHGAAPGIPPPGLAPR